MKQLSQNMRSGELSIEEVPAPEALPGRLLVRNAFSLISAGTERTKIELGRKSLIGKAVSRPDLVRKVFEKIKTDGLVKTARTVLTRLDTPTPLGYSCAGVVIEAAAEASDLPPGARVACAGAGCAVHAEVVSVPRNLCVPVPEGVSLREASLTTLGAIALQGLRQADLRLGETAVVIGLGLIGQITSQLVRAAGCRAIGVETSETAAGFARRGGLDEVIVGEGEAVVERVAEMTGSRGADATLVCASTTSDAPIELAGEVTRERGVVVAVGAVGLNIPRDAFYRKELSLRLSRSYGPGRYDPEYEEKGRDYPYAYVRWTEARNMACFLDLLAGGRISVGHLLTHDFPFDRALEAYRLLTERTEPHLGITLSYPEAREAKAAAPREEKAAAPPKAKGAFGIGVIGAGNYVQGTLLPIFRGMRGVELVLVTDADGLTAGNVARKFGFRGTAQGAEAVMGDARADLVIIGTRHDSHAELAARALAAGRDVHVEKPLCLGAGELAAVVEAQERSGRRLTVGFNRRFAPAPVAARDFLAGAAGPRLLLCRVNAGALPADHWTLDPEIGGGRILGEACHFVDLLSFLVGERPARVQAAAGRKSGAARDVRAVEDVAVSIEFSGGSAASLVYSSGGDSSVAKEYVEVTAGGRHVVIDDFRSVTLAHRGRSKRRNIRPQDKGQEAMLAAEIDAVRSGGKPPIPFAEILDSTLATLAILEALRAGRAVEPAALLAEAKAAGSEEGRGVGGQGSGGGR